MKYYTVVFDGTPNKAYTYQSNLDLPVGAVCQIVADGETTYKNNVTITGEVRGNNFGRPLRTITSYKIIRGVKRPSDRIEKVYFNKEKRTTCVLWTDGTKTIVRCAPCDEWDEEKALALCYMKRVLGNRGSFNETLKRYCNL